MNLEKPDPKRFKWLIIGISNFLVFIFSVMIKGASAFPAGGIYEDGKYIVFNHSDEIIFTPLEFYLSYAHGIVFISLALMSGLTIARIEKQRKPSQ